MVGFIEDKEIFESARVIFDTRKDDEERTKWLKIRGKSIGGSEIAKIAGYSKYGSALTVFNDKLGLSEKFKGNIHTVFGNRMKPLIKEWIQDDFEEATKIELRIFEYPYMMIHKKYKFFSANINGLARFEDNYKYYENLDTKESEFIPKNELVGLEIKTVSEFLKNRWEGDEIPNEYYYKCQWYMGVTGLNYFLLVYLIGKEVKWKIISRNEEAIKVLFEIGQDFWEKHILEKVPPAPVGLPCETKEILYNQTLNKDIEVNIGDNKLERYKVIDEQIKALEKEKEQLKQLIYLELGESKKGSNGLYKVTRYEIKKDKIDSKLLNEKYPVTYAAIKNGTTEYVTMRITKCK
ncbi:YqaJ viral recombinase family protein [Clostridium grantii]|uniref:Putative phage-type endonuclease n=1 Tax=Clostridium grantii DSM 8605 TaxID=1121316 RepID=A0A1M5R0N7_9CLOT|nr:YqaJ viral recombinase family protein [Clostridium grantii]SHH20007.1 putative phage-type endonuclease [Clostridium grantii DSM 8605]